MAEHKIPGGKEKDWPLKQASLDSLTYWATRIGDAINKGTSRFAARDKSLHQALCAEIARREGGGAQEPRPTSGQQQQTSAPAAGGAANTQIVARKPDELAGSYSTPNEVMDMMRQAAAMGHLVTPQTSCPELPAGCVIAMSLVWVDPDTETYGIPYKDSKERGLDKVALAKISSAAGIDWDPQLTGRLDNGKDPYYVHYGAVGHVRNFDGSTRTEVGQVEQDFREGSADATITATEADKIESAKKDIALKRKFILRHAETKAMNRVIRRLGLRSKYTREQLNRPFIVAKIMFTGQSDDPRLRELFAGKIADKFLDRRQQLYPGARHTTPGALPAHREQPHDPPPLGQSAADEDDFSDYPDEPEQLPQSTQGSAAVNIPAQQQRQGEPAQQGQEPKQAGMKY